MNLEFGSIRSATAHPLGAQPRWQSSRASLRGRLHTLLLAIDVTCILIGFWLASLIYTLDGGVERWLYPAAALIPIFVISALNSRAYAAEVIQEPGRGVRRALQAFVMAAGVLVLVGFFMKASQDYSRLTIALGSGFAFFLLGLCRLFFLHRAKRILGGNPYTTVLITDGSYGVRADGFSIVVAADDLLDPADDSPDMYDRLASVLSDSDRIVVACNPERRMGWVRVLKGAGIRSEIVAPELQQFAPLEMSYWGHTPTIVVADGPLSRFDQALKRAFDLAVAIPAMILLAPLFAAVAVLIKLESTGPVFFIQTRIGQGNRMFSMLKFRSMRTESCDGDGHRSTSRDDDRITKVGKFIRRTSIDELPQLLNVLLGDMSIVGPRPHAIHSKAENKLFWEIDDRYWHRHAAKPGLTGLAQVRGYRGATLLESDLTDRLQADLEYVNDWTIWRDIQILIMTFRVVLHKNAF